MKKILKIEKKIESKILKQVENKVKIVGNQRKFTNSNEKKIEYEGREEEENMVSFKNCNSRKQ